MTVITIKLHNGSVTWIGPGWAIIFTVATKYTVRTLVVRKDGKTWTFWP